jgi:tRNA (cytidine/uridine-2'-O-)-methyltransferase
VELADLLQHASWEAFLAARRGRIVLMTTKARLTYTEFSFRDSDVILLGRESAGVPDAVHEAADARLRIPLRSGLRSLNVATTAAMAVGEALRQTGQWPGEIEGNA